MPRPVFPPTPAPSTEIKAKQGDGAFLPNGDLNLPPSALSHADAPPKQRRRRSSATNGPASPKSLGGTEFFTPTTNATPSSLRTCKPIQKKPQPSSAREKATPKSGVQPAGGSGDTVNTAKRKTGSSGTGGKKVARKTAHSLIERRRRSKMNDEFEELRKMIPGCESQAMHKLAILQAANHYVRQLKSSSQTGQAQSDSNMEWLPRERQDEGGIEEGQQGEIGAVGVTDPSLEADNVLSPSDQSAASGSYDSGSTTTSPVLSAHAHTPTYDTTLFQLNRLPPLSYVQHGETSQTGPVPSDRVPQASAWHPANLTKTADEQDKEACSTLLMLNASDRRSRGHRQPEARLEDRSRPFKHMPGVPSKAMSVQDLLSR